MLYKFKSKAAGDLIMLEPNGRRVLQAILYETFAIAFVGPVLSLAFDKPASSTFGLAVVLSPIVLPGANVMVDLPVLALGVTAVLLHVRGVDRQSSLLLALGGLLAGLAFLTKYNAAVIVPVLGLYSILQRRWRTLFALLVPLAVAALWCLHNLAVYGQLHLLSHVGDPHHAVAGSLFVGLVIIGEELVWRGTVQDTLARRVGAPRAAIVSALLYALVLAPLGSLVLVLTALACGLTWGALRTFTGSLLPPVVAHLTWDLLLLFAWPVG